MAKLISPRYLQSLTNINKFLNNKYSPFSANINMKHSSCTLMPISPLSVKTYTTTREIRSLFDDRINTNGQFNLYPSYNSSLIRNLTTSKWCLKEIETQPEPEQPQKMGIVARFKDLTKKYWYVLLPVHVVTSAGWLAGFYYLSTSGVDIVALLQAMSVSESIIDKLKDSSMGHYAITYMCYKIATPVRYTVTIGGTTISIKYLSQWGYIKPLPTKDELQKMYDDKKAEIKQSYDDKKAEFRQSYDDKKAEIKQSLDDKKAEIKQSYDDKKAQIRQDFDEKKSKVFGSYENAEKLKK